MNRIFRFIAEQPQDLAAGLRGGTDDIEIRMDYYDEDSEPDVIEIFRRALKEIYDTPMVYTDEEYDDMVRKMDTAMPPDEFQPGDAQMEEE